MALPRQATASERCWSHGGNGGQKKWRAVLLRPTISQSTNLYCFSIISEKLRRTQKYSLPINLYTRNRMLNRTSVYFLLCCAFRGYQNLFICCFTICLTVATLLYQNRSVINSHIYRNQVLYAVYQVVLLSLCFPFLSLLLFFSATIQGYRSFNWGGGGMFEFPVVHRGTRNGCGLGYKTIYEYRYTKRET